ncbi:protease SohB, partial [Vibrio vulnificus]|nr:protease SohB [Vibrio vulnificus]
MEFLLDYGLFLAKVVTFIVAVVVLLILAKSVSGKSSAIKGELEITDLSE